MNIFNVNQNRLKAIENKGNPLLDAIGDPPHLSHFITNAIEEKKQHPSKRRSPQSKLGDQTNSSPSSQGHGNQQS